MDLMDDMGFQPSSPHSSSGAADSFKGTPDTRLTAFSPNDGSSRSARVLKSMSTRGTATTPVRYSTLSPNSSSTRGDPFIANSPQRKPTQKLSPTASAFHPTSTRGESSGHQHIPDIPDILTNPTSSAQLPVVSTSTTTQVGVSRCLVVTSSTHPVTIGLLDEWLQELDNSGLHFFKGRSTQGWGNHGLIRFDDIRDSTIVLAHSRLRESAWNMAYMGTGSTGTESSPGQQQDTWDLQAQVIISAISITASETLDGDAAEAVIRQLLLSHGDVFSFQGQAAATGSNTKAIVEFCAVSDADSAIVKFGNILFDGVQVMVVPSLQASSDADFIPHMELGMPSGIGARRGIVLNHEDPRLAAAIRGLAVSAARPEFVGVRPAQDSMGIVRAPFISVPTQHPFAMYPVIYSPHFGPDLPYVLGQGPGVNTAASRISHVPHSATHGGHGEYGGPDYSTGTAMQGRGQQGFARHDGRRHNGCRPNRGPYYASTSHHNHVDVGRIRDGIDVRTTIMLRNIPNKVDQAMLKRIVDESSWGKYDFMYLRIDFANDCNVGYAFINFVDPLDIIDFVNARGNQRWNCFKSDKVAEISYATIQGKDCLVQKFRNSSVMLEAPHYRPKLYFTLNGPRPDLAGQEEPFPEPDNQSKMKRSCENAEHVGLFTPNAGQHFRDEQRRRRSQYDRGTRLAALEEYNYDTTIDHVFGQH